MPSTALRFSQRPRAAPPGPHGDSASSSSPLHVPTKRISFACSAPGLGISIIVVASVSGARCYAARAAPASTFGVAGFPIVAAREETRPDQVDERARIGAEIFPLAHDDAVRAL